MLSVQNQLPKPVRLRPYGAQPYGFDQAEKFFESAALQHFQKISRLGFKHKAL